MTITTDHQHALDRAAAFAALRRSELAAAPPSHDATPDAAIAAIEAGLVLDAPTVPAAPLDVRAVASRFHAADAAWQAGLVAAFGRRASDARYLAAGQGEPGSALRALYVARHAAYAAWCEANALPALNCPVAMVPQPVQQAQARARSAFDYSSWRHGGWYVHNVRYPNCAIGCVSRNYEDGKWRIVCDPRPNAHQLHTYRTRDEAARAELALVATLPARA